MGGRWEVLVEGASCPGEDHHTGVQVDGRVCDAVQEELLLDNVLAMLHQQALTGVAKYLDSLDVQE